MKMSTGRLKGIHREEDAKRVNKESGEIWIFEHRGQAVWYNGETPDRSWSINAGSRSYYANEVNMTDENNITFAANFQLSQKYSDGEWMKQPYIVVGGIRLIEIVVDVPKTWDPDFPYVDESDIGKKGYVFTDQGKFECEIVDVLTLSEEEESEYTEDEDYEGYEWIDEITGVICFKPHWDRPIG
jgi:hypothetical protein